MKFTCSRDLILKEISVAQEIISSRNSLSILSNVLLSVSDNTLLIRATDLKVSFETKIPVDEQESGGTTVFCDKLLGILRNLPDGEIEFETQEEDKLVIHPVFGKIDFRLKCIASDKFPEIEVAPEDAFFQISQSDFIEMVTQTVFAVSDDETRYFMNGVYMEKNDEKIIMVATDGRRLSFISKIPEDSIPNFKGVIIPPKVLNLVKKQLSAQGQLSMAITDKQVFFEFDNQKLSSALIEGQFPNYQRVIPEKQETSVLIDRNKFNEALKRVSLMIEKSRRVIVQLQTGSITIMSEETEIGLGKEEISCNYEGPESKIALNFQYINDPLKVIESEFISIDFTETNKAISINASPKKDYFHIIMPMQLD